MDSLFEIVRGDITRLKVDTIVNAANSSLLGGGGVDGAIHSAAGPKLAEFCRGLGGCKPGHAKLTPGFGLPVKGIIHTVGPVWQDGHSGEAQVLADCYRNCLGQARQRGFASIAFPAISTGIYRYPLDQAAVIAVETCKAELGSGEYQPRIVFCCFDDATEQAYGTALASHGPRK